MASYDKVAKEIAPKRAAQEEAQRAFEAVDGALKAKQVSDANIRGCHNVTHGRACLRQCMGHSRQSR